VTAIAVVQYGEYRITRSWPLTIGVCTSHALARTRTSVPCGSESGPRLRRRCAAKAKAGLDRLWSCTSVAHGVACAWGSIQVSWGTPWLPLGAKCQLKHDGSNLERGGGGCLQAEAFCESFGWELVDPEDRVVRLREPKGPNRH
jgi:hypothetical protein